MQNIKVRQSLGELKRDTSVLMNVASVALAIEALESLLIEKNVIQEGEMMKKVQEMATARIVGAENLKEEPVILGLDQI